MTPKLSYGMEKWLAKADQSESPWAREASALIRAYEEEREAMEEHCNQLVFSRPGEKSMLIAKKADAARKRLESLKAEIEK